MSHDTITEQRVLPRTSSSSPQRGEPGTWATYIAEGLGTFGLVFAGCGAIMIDTLSGGAVTHVGVGLVFGLIITVMIYAFGHISGAHFNPAVTLAFVLTRHFPVRRLIGYWIAQLMGATLAAECLQWLLGDVDHLGATLPAGGTWQSLGLEALLTFFLMIVIMAMATDTRAVGQAAALAIGATVALEALFAGPVSGASMNPARSLGPALVSLSGVGFLHGSAPRAKREASRDVSYPAASQAGSPGITPKNLPLRALVSGVWTAQWVYLLAPCLGAVAGALLSRWMREAGTHARSHTAKEESHD